MDSTARDTLVRVRDSVRWVWGIGEPIGVLSTTPRGDWGTWSSSSVHFRFRELFLDKDLGDEDAAFLINDFPLETFKGVDSSSGLRPPRKSSSSRSEDLSSACII